MTQTHDCASFEQANPMLLERLTFAEPCYYRACLSGAAGVVDTLEAVIAMLTSTCGAEPQALSVGRSLASLLPLPASELLWKA